MSSRLCEGSACMKHASFGTPHERTKRWCGSCAQNLKEEHGTLFINLSAKMCEGCGLKQAGSGTLSEGKRRWCSDCGKAHGAVSLSHPRLHNSALRRGSVPAKSSKVSTPGGMLRGYAGGPTAVATPVQFLSSPRPAKYPAEGGPAELPEPMPGPLRGVFSPVLNYAGRGARGAMPAVATPVQFLSSPRPAKYPAEGGPAEPPEPMPGPLRGAFSPVLNYAGRGAQRSAAVAAVSGLQHYDAVDDYDYGGGDVAARAGFLSSPVFSEVGDLARASPPVYPAVGREDRRLSGAMDLPTLGRRGGRGSVVVGAEDHVGASAVGAEDRRLSGAMVAVTGQQHYDGDDELRSEKRSKKRSWEERERTATGPRESATEMPAGFGGATAEGGGVRYRAVQRDITGMQKDITGMQKDITELGQKVTDLATEFGEGQAQILAAIRAMGK